MKMIPLEQITPGTQTTSVAKPGVLIDTKALEALAEPMGKSAKMRIRQIRQWILQRGVLDFDRMTDLPAGFRAELTEKMVPLSSRTAKFLLMKPKNSCCGWRMEKKSNAF